MTKIISSFSFDDLLHIFLILLFVYFGISHREKHYDRDHWVHFSSLLWSIFQEESTTAENIDDLFLISFILFRFALTKMDALQQTHLDQKTHYDRNHYFRNRIEVALMTKIIPWWFYFKFLLFCFALLWQRNTLRPKSLMIYFFNLLWHIYQKKRTTKNDRLKCYDKWLWGQRIWLEDQRI